MPATCWSLSSMGRAYHTRHDRRPNSHATILYIGRTSERATNIAPPASREHAETHNLRFSFSIHQAVQIFATIHQHHCIYIVCTLYESNTHSTRVAKNLFSTRSKVIHLSQPFLRDTLIPLSKHMLAVFLPCAHIYIHHAFTALAMAMAEITSGVARNILSMFIYRYIYIHMYC